MSMRLAPTSLFLSVSTAYKATHKKDLCVPPHETERERQ
jgi:hypothetical protein